MPFQRDKKRSQLRILRHNLTYLRLSAVPLVWILPPLILIMAQMQFHYGYRGLEPEEPTLLKVRLVEDWAGMVVAGVRFVQGLCARGWLVLVG